MDNYYKILQVDSEASKDIIDKAYKTLVKKYHPDLKSGSEKIEAENMIKIINEAYDVLSDASKRKEYDEKLKKEKLLNEQKEKIKQEQEFIRKNYQNNVQIRPVNTNYNNDNYSNSNQNTNINNSTQNNYNPIKNPIQYFTQSLKQYLRNSKNSSPKYTIIANNHHIRFKYKKTFKDYLRILLTLIIIIVLGFILWHISPIQTFLKNIYNNYIFVKIPVDIIINIVTSLIQTITNTSLF